MTRENLVQSAVTTMDILTTLKNQNGAKVAEVAEELEIPTSTAYNYLRTLEENAYLVKSDREYRVATRFIEFGEHAKDNTKLHKIGKSQVDEIAQRTGERADLVVEEHGRGIYVHKAQGERAFTINTRTGQRIYLHTTALGKAILAHLPRQRVEQIIDRHGLPALSENTITDRDELFEELDKIQAQGYAVNDEEQLKGVRCIAAPILEDEDRVLGSLSVSGPKSRMGDQQFREEVTELLLEAANIIEVNARYS